MSDNKLNQTSAYTQHLINIISCCELRHFSFETPPLNVWSVPLNLDRRSPLWIG